MGIHCMSGLTTCYSWKQYYRTNLHPAFVGRKRCQKTANHFLALALLVMVSSILRIIGWLPLQFSPAFGPLLYLYVLNLTQPHRKFSWRDLLHFAPALAEICTYLMGIRFSLQPFRPSGKIIRTRASYAVDNSIRIGYSYHKSNTFFITPQLFCLIHNYSA